MARNPSTPMAALRVLDAAGASSYADAPIVCRCPSHPDGRIVYRSADARTLAVDALIVAGDLIGARRANAAGIGWASRHTVAGDDTAPVWLGCADGNNARQTDADPAPVGAVTYLITDGGSADVARDRRVRDADAEAVARLTV